MENKFILGLISIFSMSFASATLGGYYRTNSIFDNLFSSISINLNSISLMLVFTIVFFAIQWAMSQNRSLRHMSWLFSFIGAMFTTYIFWRSGMNLQTIFTNLGFGNALTYIIPVLIIGLLIIMLFKWKTSTVLLVLSGISFLLATVNSNVNPSNSATFSVLGVILLVIGIMMKLKRSQSRFRLSTLILFFSAASFFIGLLIKSVNQTFFIFLGLIFLIIGLLMKFLRRRTRLRDPFATQGTGPRNNPPVQRNNSYTRNNIGFGR